MYRLVLAGDAGSGKSSFLLRLSLNEFRGDIQTTLGKKMKVFSQILGKKLLLKFMFYSNNSVLFYSVTVSYVEYRDVTITGLR